MNDKALYQLERAAEALTLMAKYLREDKEVPHSQYWYDYDRNDLDRSNPFFGTTVSSSSSPDVITFS